MKKILLAALSLTAITGLASCEIGGGKISEEDWNAAKEKLFNLANSDASRLVIDYPSQNATYIVDGGKIEYSATNEHSSFAAWTTDPDLGRIYEFYLYNEGEGGYLKTNPGKYAIFDFDEFGGYVSFLFVAAVVQFVEYSTLIHEKTDKHYHVAIPESEDVNSYWEIDKMGNIVGYGASPSVNIMTFSPIGNKSVTLPSPVGTYPDPTV